jgi:tetratricopeptide (TPR) repeat protein
MYFESLSGDEEVRWLSKGLPNMLVTDLAQTPGLDVVSSQRIHEILTEIGQEDLDTINKSLVPEIAQRAGAGAVVVGSIFKSGPEIRLDVQVQDVGSGRVLSAESVRGKDVFPLVDELTDRIRASLDLGDRPAGRPIAEVTTPSLDAFQLYSEGLEALRNVRRRDARKALEEAVEMDPSFAMAYFGLWGLARQLGETSRADQYRKKVLEHLDRLPERQKLLVQATAGEAQGKPEEAENILEGLLARYPDEEEAYRELGRVYGGLNQPERVLATAERAVKAIPRSGSLRNTYGYALLQRARYAEGIREFETYAKLNPNEPNPHDSLGEAYLFTGQPERALEKYTRALEIDPSFGSEFNRAWAYGMLGRYDDALADIRKTRNSPGEIAQTNVLAMHAFTLSRVGRYRDAEESLKEAAELAVRQGNIAAEVDVDHLSAVLELERGQYADVIVRTRRTQERIPAFTVFAHLLAGIAEVHRGNLEAARAHLDSQVEIYDPYLVEENWMYHTLQGEIALGDGDLAAAESAFAAGETELKMWLGVSHATRSILSIFINNLTLRDGFARVRKEQGDLAGAVEIYRKLNTPDISNKYTSMMETRFVLETARLLDETGDKEGARAEYERFLELWKNADAGLPELKEARAYVAK